MRKAFLLVALFLSPAFQSNAADDCDKILDSKLMNQSDVKDENFAYSAAKSAFCSTDEGESERRKSLGMKLNIIGKGSGGGRGTDDALNSWHRQNCGSASAEQEARTFHYAAQKALNETAIKSWEICKLGKKDLTCYVNPTEDQLTVVVRIKFAPVIAKPTVVDDSAIVGGQHSDQTKGTRLYNKGSPFYVGDDSIIVQRKGNSPITARLSVIYNGEQRMSCDVFAPFVKPVTPPQIVSQITPQKTLLDSFNIIGNWCAVGGQMKMVWQAYRDEHMLYMVDPTTGQISRLVEQYIKHVTVTKEQPDKIQAVAHKVQVRPLPVPGQPIQQPSAPLKTINEYKVISADEYQVIETRDELSPNQWSRTRPLPGHGKWKRC